MITYKNILRARDNAQTSQEKAKARKEYFIYTIASNDHEKQRVSEATYKKARRVFNAWQRLTDQEQSNENYDNDERRYTPKGSARREAIADNMRDQLKTLLKDFKAYGYTVVYSSCCASIMNNKNNVLYLG